MSIGKIIKTGLAIYGGTVLAKKLGRYIFAKNKDKIAAKIKEKITSVCDKAIDEVFHGEEKKASYSFKPSDIWFHNADEAYDVRQKMIGIIYDHGMATVADFKNLVGVNSFFSDYKYGWKDPNIFEVAPIERKISALMNNGYVYFIDCLLPGNLEV